jgi:hypothetical protein
MSLESDGGMILTGENRRTRRKTCTSATLSTTNPTWIDPGANPGLCGETPSTNDLNHGTANQALTSADEGDTRIIRHSDAIGREPAGRIDRGFLELDADYEMRQDVQMSASVVAAKPQQFLSSGGLFTHDFEN